MMGKKKYLSDCLKDAKFLPGFFNIVASGTGTGKTEFIRRAIMSRFDGIDASEILYVTSRSMIRDQQAMLDGISRLGKGDLAVVKYWNGDYDTVRMMEDAGIWIMNYNQLIDILDKYNASTGRTLSKVKVVVFDECHAVFSDDFIEGMFGVRVWVRERLSLSNTIFIGLTATPGIMLDQAEASGIHVRRVNEEYLINYRAKNLYCVRQELVPHLLRELGGRSLIMSLSLRAGERLRSEIPNSVVLCSPGNDAFTPAMNRLRDYIILNNALPDTTETLMMDDIYPIDCLIVTATMREGVNISKPNGIKNVVCCVPDELHVTQFVGRCRFDVENLIVCSNPVKNDNRSKENYLTRSRRMYLDYVENPNDSRWFDTLREIVQCDFKDVRRWGLDGIQKETLTNLKAYLKAWVCTPNMSPEELKARRIYAREPPEELLSLGEKCRLPAKKHGGKCTLLAIMKTIMKEPEYEVVSKDHWYAANRKKRYYLIYRKGNGNEDEKRLYPQDSRSGL